jgi:hypothetical protein
VLDNGVFRLRQHGTVLSFSQKCGSVSHIFGKKDVQFRPAGGDMSFRVRNRVSRVTNPY